MKPPTTGDIAEARVARYLRERGYTYEIEPEFGTGRHPDYLITAAEHTIVAEVKSFDTKGLFQDFEAAAQDGIGQVLSRPVGDGLAPLRKTIKKAAGQLKGLQDRGWPLVVVLDNPAGRPIPFTSELIVSAMYGDLAFQVSAPTDGSHADLQAIAGRNGRLTNDHTYISAVAVVRHESHAAQWAARWFDTHRPTFADGTEMAAAFAAAGADAPAGDEIFLEVFETVSTSAVPLPRDVFNGPRDVRWAPNADRTGLVCLSPAVDGP